MKPVLYIIMRNDMPSLNPGKAMAQAAHAANFFTARMEYGPVYEDHVLEGFGEWGAGEQSFGTTIVMEAPETLMKHAVSRAEMNQFPAGIVRDETYPIQDGACIHYAPVDTCGWIFTPCKDQFPVHALRGFTLHP